MNFNNCELKTTVWWSGRGLLVRRKQNTKKSWRRRSTRVRGSGRRLHRHVPRLFAPRMWQSRRNLGTFVSEVRHLSSTCPRRKSSLRESVLRLRKSLPRPAECDRNLLTSPRNERSRLRARQVVWLEILRDKAWIEPHELPSRHVCLLGPVQRHPRVRIEVFTQMGSHHVCLWHLHEPRRPQELLEGHRPMRRRWCPQHECVPVLCLGVRDL